MTQKQEQATWKTIKIGVETVLVNEDGVGVDLKDERVLSFIAAAPATARERDDLMKCLNIAISEHKDLAERFLTLQRQRDKLLAVTKAVRDFAANQMWHLQGGTNGSHAQTLYNQMEAAITGARS